MTQHAEDPLEPTTWKKVRRLFEMTELLRVRDRSSQEFARIFGVSQRTVQRDLDDLKELGLGLAEQGHRYRLPAATPPFRPVEALAVHAATRLLYHHAASKNRDYLLALEKLTASLPVSLQGVVRHSIQDVSPQLHDDGLLERVTLAWVERRFLSFTYKPPNGPPERREFAVYFVEISRSNLAPYIIGFDRLKRSAIRTFKLSRVRNVTLMDERYDIPPDFDPRQYLTDAWGVVGDQQEVVTVTLSFGPEAAYRVLEGGYPNLTVEEMGRADQGVTVKVRAGVDHSGLPRELMPWILGWGPRVEVLSPAHVRAHWLNEARAVTEKYGDTHHGDQR